MAQPPFSSTHIPDLFLRLPLSRDIPHSLLPLQPWKICTWVIHLGTFNAYFSGEIKINHSIWMKNRGCRPKPTKGDGGGGGGGKKEEYFLPFPCI